MEYIIRYKKIIISLVIFIISILAFGIYYFYEDNDENIYALSTEINTTTTTVESETKFYVDIKGAVKKPGVYQVENGTIVNDVIKLAGGLKSTASTKNINLSQKVTSEMVIYIFTKNELKTTKVKSDTTCTTNVIEVNNCITEQVTTNIVANGLININTASKEELMTIPNIGASKADSIIIYRMENKFNSIEDIQNVSGIGESLFDKIKDYITV